MKSDLTLAIPTGRIFAASATLLDRAGLSLPSEIASARKLHVTNGSELAFVLAKDRDVPTYVEHGVADAGIVGKDVLAESEPDVLQPLDLLIGRCRMVVARPRETEGSYRDRPLVRVATKYPRVAVRHFHGMGIPVEVIPLAGSVEIAPILGLADCIVDMVETGKTLEANGLVVDEVLFESSGRLIVNRASFRLKSALVEELVGRLGRQVSA